ncbi:MAG: hypothetical protein P1P87_01075 [Trueperaceae bacterium]|nr:hypothetical protein [Trueperaceae bacterium]
MAFAASVYAGHRAVQATIGTHPWAAAYLNDLAAAVGFAGVVDAIVRATLRRPARAVEVLGATAFGAIVWELGPLAWPSMRPGAVADLWDVLAYVLGALTYLLVRGGRAPIVAP